MKLNLDKEKNNSQGNHLINKGIQIQTIKQQIITPYDVNIPQINKEKRIHQPIYINNTIIETKTTTCRVLDGFALLEVTGLGFPEDCRKATLTGLGYSSVIEEDLLFFNGLVYLDVSDNFFNFKCFELLPRLKELRIVCNNIETIDELNGYDALQCLDLSYNKLTPDSILNLAILPNLRELDLSGNNLGTLPSQMDLFINLERLVLEHNKISDNDIFIELSTLPKLRDLDLAFNLLSCIPPQACTEGRFRLMDTLDLAYNYIGSQSALEPLIDLPRMLTLIIYGNPILGSSGEDPTGIYVEELLDMAYAARDGYTLKPLDIITEIPKKRVLRKGGFVSGRHALYKEFSVIHVENEMESLKKTAYEYKKEGNQTLFAQAVNIAKKNNLTSTGSALQLPEYDTSSNTFLTGIGLVTNIPTTAGGNMSVTSNGTNERELYREKAIADSVMKDVAKEMNLLDLSDIERLRRKLNREDIIKHDEGNIPVDIFGRSITDPNPLTTYPVALNTALKSLRYAIEHPLTDHNTVPSSILHPPQHHIKSTTASERRQMPRRTADGQLIVIPKFENKTKLLNKPKSPIGNNIMPPVNNNNNNNNNNNTNNTNNNNNQTNLTQQTSNKKSEESKLESIPIHMKPTSPSVFKQSMSVRKRQNTVEHKQQINKALRATTLQQIEEVLDGLNKNTQEIISKHPTGPDSVLVKGVARPNTGVKGLIDMVNNVVYELQS